MGNLAFFFMYRYGWRIVVAAPVLGQSSHILYEAGMAAYRMCSKSKVHASSATVSIRGRMGKIVSVTGSVNAHKQGEKGHIVMMDEKQDIPGASAAEDFIGMKIRGGCMWLVGVGGSPTSAGEMFRDNAFISSLPWTEYSKWETDYIEEKVTPARKLMLPEQFAAHYECKALDMNSHLLVPSMQSYKGDIADGHVRIGIDWGKRRDRSAATVVTTKDSISYITGWLVPTGTYDEQMDQLTHWLKDEIDYDQVISEDVGVGDPATDFLKRSIRGTDNAETGVFGHGVSSKWISKQAVRINRMAGNGSLKYNPDHLISDMFYRDITQVGYKILDNNLIKLPSSGQPGHSDFMSSLMLAMVEPQQVYL